MNISHDMCTAAGEGTTGRSIRAGGFVVVVDNFEWLLICIDVNGCPIPVEMEPFASPDDGYA